jgi:DNA-binding MarR family transcriptional regulator
MPLENKSTIKRQVLVDSRESGISYTLLRNAISKRLGLNGSDFEGLDLIFYRGAATPTELAQYTGLSSGSTTVMIDRLERSGLVKRQNNPHDRRGTLVVIDSQAACEVGPLFTSIRVAQSKLLGAYSTEELELLTDYFKKIAMLYERERKKVSTVIESVQ